jgi:signal transduction histidine kinase
MRRRAAEIRGQLSIEPTPEGGTTVRLNAPFR